MFKLLLLCFLYIDYCLAVNPWEPEPGSGWWLQRHQQLTQYTQQHKNQVKALFIGASITDYWQAEGRPVWDSYYVPKGSADYGIGGDTTSNVLWRIQNKEMDGLTPKVLVIGSGPGYNTMNRSPSPSASDVLKGHLEIIRELRSKFPLAKVIVMAHTPYTDPSISQRSKQINNELKKLADNQNVFFIDLTSRLTDGNGHQIAKLFKSDHLHLSIDGYNVWHEVMKSTFERLLQ
ncbi:platelet-activating factor acetylhydrolase IB subunit alpha2-like [Oppia nitens]|uniref:platelet-activating factor acetylhydrolase IB subunit alpha2-like n=1 Tax=Oppia nitens TaxID=1686743 RepID=UPI0023D9AC02|nr:platelet-activating factor acetylhydrolase IB subunit alpha2-like [Oppia nitens]